MKQIPASLLTLTAGILITLISLWVGQNHGLLPVQASEQAPLVDNFFNLMVTIGTALFLVVQGAIVLFVILFRQRPGDDTDGEPIEGNFSLEIFWTAIPALIVIGLGIYSVEVYQQMGGFSAGSSIMAHNHSLSAPIAHHSNDTKLPAGSAYAAPLVAESSQSNASSYSVEAIAEVVPELKVSKIPNYGISNNPENTGKAADLVVNVTGLQFAWVFNYPDSGVTTGELHVPVGKDVLLSMAAQDVIHSFWVPQFRLKQDVIPGEKTELRFVATRVGEYPVVCAELCGSYHGAMRTKVIVHQPAEYEQWLAQSQVAQASDLQQAIAVASADTLPSERLLPYAQELGITAETLAQIHASHQYQ